MGLVAESPTTSHRRALPQAPTAELDRHEPAKISMLDKLRFVRSAWIAHRCLRDQPIQEVVQARIERRRKFSDVVAFDFGQATQPVRAFTTLRPFIPRNYLCLFDSLALLDFLAEYRLFPDFVFGVIADPFEAHCWLQADGVVINDSVERVSLYKPIMCV
jgi:hypothetical protein